MSLKSDGKSFVVNTTVTGTQRYGDVSGLKGGGFASVWADGDNTIRLQRLDTAGAKTGGEIVVNTPADAIIQGRPAVAGLDDGGFVVVWSNYLTGIVAQRFDAAGKEVGAEILINASSGPYRSVPSVTAVEGGGFAVSWESRKSSSDVPNVVSQLVSGTGTKVGGEQAVTSVAGGFGASGSSTAQLDKGYVVAWQDNSGSGTGSAAIKLQRFDEAGAKAGAAVTVATAANFVASPRVVALESGFVAVWTASEAEGYAIRAQRFDDAGKAVGSVVTVEAASSVFVSNPDVTALSGGGFAVAWQRRDLNVGDTDLYARGFKADGTADGLAFQVNPVSTGEQMTVRLANGPDGKLVAIWTDQNGGTIDIQGQVFTDPDAPKPPTTTAGQHAPTLDASPAMLLDLDGNTSRVSMSLIEFGRYRADSAALSDGGFVSLIRVLKDDGDITLQAQRFDAAGRAVGTAITVAKGGANDLNYVQVEGLNDGRFAVLWTLKAKNPNSTLDSVISSRVYDAKGNIVGTTATIGADTHQERFVEDVELLKDGSYVTMWTARPKDGLGQSYIQRFSADNQKVGGEIKISAYTTKDARGESLTLRSDGGYVLSYKTGLVNLGQKEITWVRLLDGQGRATGQFQVSESNGITAAPKVIALDNGRFAVAWGDKTADGNFFFRLQVFDAKGAKVGTELKWANTSGIIDTPDLVETQTGFLAVWSLQNERSKAVAWAFDKAGQPVGSIFGLDDIHVGNKEAFAPDYITLKDGRILAIEAQLATTSQFDREGNTVVEATPGKYTYSYPYDAVLTGHFLSVQNPITGTAGAETLTGTAGADRIQGLAGKDTLKGLAGDDVLIGGADGDALDGGAGTDVASYATAKAAITLILTTPSLNQGDAAGDSYTSIERFVGSKFKDTMTGDRNVNYFDGGVGDDILAGLAGNDTLIGSYGNDLMEGGAGADRLDGGVGIDTATYALASAGVTASLRTPSTNTGDAAGDTYVKIESLFGSAFADRLSGDGDANRLDGAGGDDVLFGDHGDDFLFGGEGDDTLRGGNGADRMEGGAGNDTFEGGAGGDRMYGGAGIDTVTYANAAPVSGRTGVIVNLGARPDDSLFVPGGFTGGERHTGEAKGDGFKDIENLTGSNYDDELTGTAGANILQGLAGNDTLIGLGGGDRLQGGAGNDIYRVASNADTVDESLKGSNGIDTVEASVTFNLANTARVLGRVENLTLTGASTIDGFGDDFRNVLTGNGAANRLDGGKDADTMRGGGGGDTYFVDNDGDLVDESVAGSSGIDSVVSTVSFSLSGPRALGAVEHLALKGSAKIDATGNALANDIVGNTGANVITGLGGADRLDGGKDSAADTFVYRSLSDSGTTSATRDSISNFGAGDRIDLSLLDANATKSGLQDFVLDTDRSFSAGEIRQTVQGKNVLLEMNTDGDAAAEMSILIVNSGPLDRSDFIL